MAETLDPFEDFDPEAPVRDPHGRPLAPRYESEDQVPPNVRPLRSLAEEASRGQRAAERARLRYLAARQQFYDDGGQCFECKDTGITPLRGEDSAQDIYCHCDRGIEQYAAAQQRKNDLLIRNAGGSDYILPFQTHPLPSSGKRLLERWVVDWPYQGPDSDEYKPWLTLIGITGSGKSQIAATMMRKLIIDRQISGAFIDCVQLVADLREQFSKKATAPPDLEKARNTPIVVLDDIGAWKHSDYAEEQLLAIIARRYVKKWPTIITTNLDTDDGTLAAMVGDRAFGRIVELSFIARIGTRPEDNLRLRK